MAETTDMVVANKPPLKPKRRIVASIAIGTAIAVVAVAIFSLFSGHNSAAQGTSASFIHRIDRLTALCGSVGGVPRCRRWHSS